MIVSVMQGMKETAKKDIARTLMNARQARTSVASMPSVTILSQDTNALVLKVTKVMGKLARILMNVKPESTIAINMQTAKTQMAALNAHVTEGGEETEPSAPTLTNVKKGHIAVIRTPTVLT